MSGGEGTNYEQFDAQRYLKQLFGDITLLQDVPTYVDLFAQFPDKSLTMLDCGGGPNVFPLIMARRKGHSLRPLRLREEQQGREGKGGTGDEVASREARMRSVLEAVVPCDVTADNVVAEGYAGPYDVVTCAYCLECVFTSFEAISEAIGRISKLVKPGGYLILTASSILDPPEPPFFVETNPRCRIQVQGLPLRTGTVVRGRVQDEQLHGRWSRGAPVPSSDS
eukprot:Em0520g2a